MRSAPVVGPARDVREPATLEEGNERPTRPGRQVRLGDARDDDVAVRPPSPRGPGDEAGRGDGERRHEAKVAMRASARSHGPSNLAPFRPLPTAPPALAPP